MLICHCRAVNDQTIRATILAGAQCPEEVRERCGAGGRCGGCLAAVKQLLAQASAEAGQPAHTSAA